MQRWRPGLTAFLALLHHGRIRLPILVLELEEAVQLVQVRDVPLQDLRLRLVLGPLLVRPLPQHAHLGPRLLPERGQLGQGDWRLYRGQLGVPGMGGLSLSLGVDGTGQPGFPWDG